jgi:protein required for attachment to host cells
MKPIVTWVLIADGAQARVLENTGPGKGLTRVDGLEFSQEPLLAQEITSDRQGRSFSSAGYGRSGYEPKTDPVEHREAAFLKTVAAMLDKKHCDRAYDRLVIAAAPIALGDLRKALTEGVKKSVLAEIPKDLINTPTTQLNRHLDGIIAV